MSEKDSLGPEQEAWLKEEIRNSNAHFTLIAAGIQMLANDRPGQEHFYPKSVLALLSVANPRTRRSR